MTRASLSFDSMFYTSHKSATRSMFQTLTQTRCLWPLGLPCTTSTKLCAASHPIQPTLARIHFWGGTYLDEIGRDHALVDAALYASIHRWSCVAMETTATTLGSEMDIHCEEFVFLLVRALAAYDLPLRNKGLATRGPRFVGRIDAARIVLQGGAVQNFICV